MDFVAKDTFFKSVTIQIHIPLNDSIVSIDLSNEKGFEPGGVFSFNIFGQHIPQILQIFSLKPLLILERVASDLLLGPRKFFLEFVQIARNIVCNTGKNRNVECASREDRDYCFHSILNLLTESKTENEPFETATVTAWDYCSEEDAPHASSLLLAVVE